ncbi:MAG: ABC transporter [Chloroflexi bacterium RBG_16_51_16]|nr:MAG: ABC transporter [Chloroflexi bacterium RBG_16_51_16]
MDHTSEVSALKMVGITKRFPGVLANDQINFEVKAGEVHGLLGENGAGKTTLMKILYGLHQPDEGEIHLNGEKVKILSPRAAADLGIGMVHQHFMLVENLTALENVVLGLPAAHPPLLDLEPARLRFKELTREYDLRLDPSTPVWQLPVGDQQWLEILKLLFRDARLVILDEPTAVLAPKQAKQLFQTVRRLAAEGRAIVFISHKLEEMKEVAERVTVLRDGHVVGTVDPKVAKPSELAQMMVGRDVFLSRRERKTYPEKRDLLVIEGLSCLNDRKLPALNNLNLTVKSGEIVGVAGVDGNGQRELAECISGLRQFTSGSILINGIPVDGVVKDNSLLGYVPEDRHKTGLVLNFTVEENLFLKTFAKFPYTKRGFIQWREIRKKAEAIIREFEIRTPGSSVTTYHLSGGNQQKVVVARELSSDPALMLTSQPTRGLDLGAVESVHKMLLSVRNRGGAVLFISTELPEVMALSDRIIVMFKGQIMGDLVAEDADVNRIGELMLGHQEAMKTIP